MRRKRGGERSSYCGSRRNLTVKLRGRPEAPVQAPAVHGPLQRLLDGKSNDPTVALCFPPLGFEHALGSVDDPLISSQPSEYAALIVNTQGLRVLPRIEILWHRLLRITALRTSIQLGMVRLVSEYASALLYREFRTKGTHQYRRGGKIRKEADQTRDAPQARRLGRQNGRARGAHEVGKQTGTIGSVESEESELSNCFNGSPGLQRRSRGNPLKLRDFLIPMSEAYPWRQPARRGLRRSRKRSRELVWVNRKPHRSLSNVCRGPGTVAPTQVDSATR
jgi:hypothetical protein